MTWGGLEQLISAPPGAIPRSAPTAMTLMMSFMSGSHLRGRALLAALADDPLHEPADDDAADEDARHEDEGGGRRLQPELLHEHRGAGDEDGAREEEADGGAADVLHGHGAHLRS